MDERKTRKVAGVDLSANRFAFIGDENDSSSWRFCIHVPGDALKTRNLISVALSNLEKTPAHVLTQSQRDALRLMLTGAAMSHGIEVERPPLLLKIEAPTQAAQLTPARLEIKDSNIEAAIALADRHADELLRSLGWE
jgi:hypothetical protein